MLITHRVRIISTPCNLCIACEIELDKSIEALTRLHENIAYKTVLYKLGLYLEIFEHI